MKKAILLTAALLLGIMLSAQTQQGYVKTKGRMVNGQIVHGQGLKGATVSIKGRAAVVVNKEDGSFSFPIPEAQFHVDSVRKKGYQLVDMDVLSMTYRHSSNPIYLVMETPEQQLQDQLAAERKIRRTLTDQLHQREDEIEALKEQQKISEEEYRQALQKLYEETDQNEQLVKDMVERYSTIDYDQLSEFDQRISEFILNGELVKADSLLRTKGNIDKRIEEYKKHQAVNAKEKEELSQRQEQLEQSELLAQKELEDLANDCYRKFEIFKMQHLNDSAAYYLEQRIILDSTNLEWKLEYGCFITDYTGEYNKALHVFQNVFQHSLELYGENHRITIDCMNNLGHVYSNMYEDEKAIEYYSKALSSKKTLYGENHPDVALGYNNLGSILFFIDKDNEALECFNKALSINKVLFCEDRLAIALIYNNMGALYFKNGNYEDALKYFEMSLNIRKKILGENSPEVTSCYFGLSDAYQQLGNYDKAKEFTTKALSIQKLIFGKNHPAFSRTYKQLGEIYDELDDFENALIYFNKALSVDTIIYGEHNRVIAEHYNSIGILYQNHDRHEESLRCFLKALEIGTKAKATNLQMAQFYNNISITYSKMENHVQAIFYSKKALDLLISMYGSDHPYVGITHNTIGKSYYRNGDFEQALIHYDDALRILLPIFGEDSPNIAPLYYNYGEILYEKGDYDNALKFLYSALSIFNDSLPQGHSKTIKVENKIAEIQAKLKEQENEQKTEE